MKNRYQMKKKESITISHNSLFTFSPIGKSLYSFRGFFLEMLYSEEDQSYYVFGKYNKGEFMSNITNNLFSNVGKPKIGEPEKYDRTGPNHYIVGQKCLVKIMNHFFDNENDNLFCIKCCKLNDKVILEDIIENIHIVNNSENSYSICK